MTDLAPRLFEEARREIAKVVVGQDDVVEQVLVCLFAGGHVLIEGTPGTAKTLLIRAVARVFNCVFKRIQFTPDLMPADITGTNIFDPRQQEFQFRPGPVFGQLVLGDEINRAPAKTQAALLEAMQERQVTVDGVSHPLPEVFTVFATQNPIEQEGTYPLPEAQLDRFMMKVLVNYPTEDQEAGILRVHQQGIRIEDLSRFELQTVAGAAELLQAQEEIRQRTVREELLPYIARIIRATRSNLRVEFGASPRAGVMILTAAKARAALQGRGHVLPDDIKAVARPVLRHRILLKPGAEIDGFRPEEVIDGVLAQTEVPR
ncbi:MAG TPA: MoxR family ATPase [Gemmataceae bacterium]|nr:MoxR family ATPase [Gemmataceae bacterium]